MKITILDNGNLESAFDNDEEANDALERYMIGEDDLSILVDGLESYSTNGSLTAFDAGDGNPFVGLTEAPCIAEGMDVSDDGKNSVVGRFWYFEGYMIFDFINIMLTDQRVVFTLYKE